ncbi:hypothetical protein B0H10DRAFT_1961990, partial [Mycena sp. CBHHK59/15]
MPDLGFCPSARRLEEDDDNDGSFQTAVEYAVKNLESTTITKAAVGVDIGVMDRQVHGHAQKARINSRDTLAEALETSYRRLKHQTAQDKDLDQEIKTSRLPDHLQFLMALSAVATPATLAYADTYLEGIKNPPPPPPGLTWAEILRDDPFEGEHWEGVYGLPPGSVRNTGSRRGSNSSSSNASLSPLNSDDLELDDEDEDDSFSSLDPEEDAVDVPTRTAEISRPPHTYAHRKEFEQLQARQYWRDDYAWPGDPKGTHSRKRNGIVLTCTIGPAIQRALAQERGSLGALQMQHEGRKNIMLSLVAGVFKTATIAQQLRGFVAFVFSSSSSQWIQSRTHQNKKSRITRTLEAFADAIDAELRLLDKWCAAREEAICCPRAGTRLVVSLLSTQKALDDAFESGFAVLLDVVRAIATCEHGRYALLPRTPAALSALLLDTLFEKVQVYMERGDGRVTADTVMRVFVVCAEPVWGMVGRWLKEGMGLGSGMGVGQGEDLDDEFFIEGSGLAVGMAGLGVGVGLLDPEFWAEGYVLRDGVVQDDEGEDDGDNRSGRAIPVFLEHVAIPVLASGKAVGLLRALGVPR